MTRVDFYGRTVVRLHKPVDTLPAVPLRFVIGSVEGVTF